MKIVLAPDSFKESLSACEVARAMRRGALRAAPEAETVLVPMADGGEGTVDALVAATGGRLIECGVHGPLGRSVTAGFGLLGDGHTAAVEMATASGLARVEPGQRDILRASSFGTGELIRAALEAGARKIIVGIGGSATNDGGCGMARALGARLWDAAGRELAGTGEDLEKLERIEVGRMDRRLAESEVLVACDVTNPLCGPEGAARVYGPQKGAGPEVVERLDRGLANFARVAARDLGADVAGRPGAGAAGGLGAGLVAFLGARLARGAELVIAAVGLDEKLRGADLVLTGEGRLDATTARGKTVAGVAGVARQAGVAVVALAGQIEADDRLLSEMGLTAWFPIGCGPMTRDDLMARAAEWVESAAFRVVRQFGAPRRGSGPGVSG